MVEQRANSSVLGVPEFPDHLYSRLEGLKRMTRRFRVVPGGEVKPRLDSGAKGTPSYHDFENESRWPARIVAQTKKNAEEKFLKIKEKEASFEDQTESGFEIKPEEVLVDVGDSSKVKPLFVPSGEVYAAWQSA